jgi:asparagine synthetase B (glutamine-hydrolysing)
MCGRCRTGSSTTTNGSCARTSTLGGHRLHTRCDTEVIPHLYEDVGPRFAERLRGTFGIAVWDQSRRRAVLARDRLGVKPLYWARSGDLLVFASELKSLLASGLIGGELDYEAIDAYLTLGFVPAPRTPLAQVSKLLPGHQLVIEDGGFKIERYWNVPRADRRLPETPRRGVRRGPARGARRGRPPAPDERRPARSDAQRWSRLLADRRADGAAHERAGQDLLGGVLG